MAGGLTFNSHINTSVVFSDIKIWWSDPIRKISEVSESDPDPKSMLKT